MARYRRSLLAVTLTAALFAAGCGDGTTEPAVSGAAPGEDTTVTTTAPSEGSATSAGAVATGGDVDTDALETELAAALDTWRESNGAPAAALAVRLPDGDTVAVAAGVDDLGGDEATPEDYFRIGSVTKTMTAAVMLELVDEGLVDLDEPVSSYLDDWLGENPSEDEITVRQLMNHTNGLIEYAFDPGFYILASSRPGEAFEPEEVLAYIGTRDPLFAPGTDYSYETGGFVAAGLIIEEVTGNPAVEEMHARIFDPAGATDIYLPPAELPPDPVVHGYVRGELYSAITLLPGYADDVGETIDGEPVFDIGDDDQTVLQSVGWTGGGIEAQVDDVAAIWAAMFDGTILSPEAIEQMTDTVYDANYGLGLRVEDVDGTLVYNHGGGVPGFRSNAGYLPDEDIAYALSSSLIPLPEDADVDQLRDEVISLLVG